MVRSRRIARMTARFGKRRGEGVTDVDELTVLVRARVSRITMVS